MFDLTQEGIIGYFIFNDIQTVADESTVINLKVVKSNGESATIHDCDVPIFLPNCGGLGAIPADHLQLDLTIQLLADYIDGFRYIGKIAAEADMDINIVKATIQNLM